MKYLLTSLLILLTLTFAQQEKRPELAHTETVQIGPYSMKVGFSRWPVLAQQSLDVLFMPEGGIKGKTATLTVIDPAGDFWAEGYIIPRFPRDRSIWGFDITAFDIEGQHKFKLELDGPEGKATGEIDVVMLPPPPFLPTLVSWVIGLSPLIIILVTVLTAWFRVRPGKRENTWVWQV
jgi:hypothetical protein